jgi:molecular chaperone DnaJ
MSKDYYKVLGVEKNASADEIKKAFRKLAHQHHPDKKGGDESKFKEINEAFQVLGDEKKRSQYDQFGADFEQQGGFGGGAGWEDFMRQARGGAGGFQFDFGGGGFGDIFGDFFGGGGRGHGQTRGNDIQIDIELQFREAVFGVEREIKLTKINACDVCDGTGAEPGSKKNTCNECKGQGQVRRMQQTILGAMQTAVVCPTCKGHGQTFEHTCKHCRGEGRVRSESKYTIKIPGGIDNGGTIRISGKGEFPGFGGVPGDLYVRVRVRPDSKFVREGNNVFTEEHIQFPQAVLGDTIEVDTLDGRKKIGVPEGTQSHQQIRLKGLGVPEVHGTHRGDQYVKIIVDVPKKLSRSAKKMIEELGKEL